MLENTELDALDRQVSFFDSLELLLQNELDSRRNNKIDRLIKKDNFKGYVCIEELEAVDTGGIHTRVINQLITEDTLK